MGCKSHLEKLHTCHGGGAIRAHSGGRYCYAGTLLKGAAGGCSGVVRAILLLWGQFLFCSESCLQRPLEAVLSSKLVCGAVCAIVKAVDDRE